MKKIIWDLISKPGKVVNEDIAYGSEKMGWVLDAATGLTNNKFTTAGSDGEWFVKEWNKYLKNNLGDTTKDIGKIIEEGISIIESKFYKDCNRNFIEAIERPSASIALIRINNSKVEYFLLGDCTMLIRDISGKIIKFKDNKLEKLDNRAIELMHNERIKNQLTFKEAREKINPVLIKHRLLKNTEEGYWTLEFNKDSVNHCLKGEISISEIENIALMSDGYSAIFDTYNYFNEEELIHYLNDNNVDKIYKIIREIENEDKEIMKYPRFKKSDDSSVVFYKFLR